MISFIQSRGKNPAVLGRSNVYKY